MLNKIGFYIAASITCLLFIILMILVINDKTQNFDIDVMHFFVNHRGSKTGFWYYFARIFTEMGNAFIIIAVILILGMYYRFDHRFFYLAIFVGVEVLIGHLTKYVFDRARPDEIYRWVKETSPSFPSGHSNASACLYLSIIFIEIFDDNNKILKIILISLSSLFMIIVPITRLILSVHYFTDVIGGMLFGTTFVILGYVFIYPIVKVYYEKIKNKFIKTE